MLANDQLHALEDRPPTAPGGLRLSPRLGSAAVRRRPIALLVVAVILVVCFSHPLYTLVRSSLRSELFSYILLIPFISLYLAWPKRRVLSLPSRPAWRLALVLVLAGFVLLTGYWLAVRSGWKPKTDDYLACMMLALLSFLWAAGCVFLGRTGLRQVAFPLAFLIFMVPFPALVVGWIESFLQHRSAEAAYVLLTWSGMPVLRHGTGFQLPGFSLQVGPECSGIHSTLVLFITSLLAGHLLLRRNWTRAVLAAAVIPLAILRNGLRVFTLAQLCVRVNPAWIDSDLHHRGGPLWFVLSLAPFFLLLLFLRKWESRTNKSIPPQMDTDQHG
ncbi:MAG: exosortase/archaeosortase family protein [Limisphaerales bacterium]